MADDVINVTTCMEQAAEMWPEVGRLLGEGWEARVIRITREDGTVDPWRDPVLWMVNQAGGYAVQGKMEDKPFPHISLELVAHWLGADGQPENRGYNSFTKKVAVRWATGEGTGYSWHRKATGFVLRGVTAEQVAAKIRDDVQPKADQAVASRNAHDDRLARIHAAAQPFMNNFEALAGRIGGTTDQHYRDQGLQMIKWAPGSRVPYEPPLTVGLEGLLPDMAYDQPCASITIHDVSPALALRIAEMVMEERMRAYADANLAYVQSLCQRDGKE